MQRACIVGGALAALGILGNLMVRRFRAAAAAPSLKFLVLHGLGMDKRGYVDTHLFGTTTLAQYNERIQAWAAKVGCWVASCGEL